MNSAFVGKNSLVLIKKCTEKQRLKFLCVLRRRCLDMQVLWLGNWDKMELENKDKKEV